ncbi:ABC transporter ATPase [Lutibacter sp. B1]|uniref:ABC transporter ATPase n=1 Tax=Lutibacter sp. B1 TaxID=2725996 RepID=UPI001457513C|nr:ABC transporter ATPase [Lutibacter sp. B1]NLP57673.1 ABC transporter ATPase [Lutibacter sp. B1]
MIIDFNNIPDYSKIWIFPSSRKFYEKEISEIHKSLEKFLTNWEDKNTPVTCAYSLKYDRFIIITVDDAENSLSIEAHNKLTDFIQSLEKQYEVILLDKINVCFKQGEFVQYKELIEFKKLIKNKAVSTNATIFNNLITTKEELEYDWEINIMDSWLGKLL